MTASHSYDADQGCIFAGPRAQAASITGMWSPMSHIEPILIFYRVSEFAPPSMQKILSYASGYLAALGWQGFIATASYMTGQQIFIAASV